MAVALWQGFVAGLALGAMVVTAVAVTGLMFIDRRTRRRSRER